MTTLADDLGEADPVEGAFEVEPPRPFPEDDEAVTEELYTVAVPVGGPAKWLTEAAEKLAR